MNNNIEKVSQITTADVPKPAPNPFEGDGIIYWTSMRIIGTICLCVALILFVTTSIIMIKKHRNGMKIKSTIVVLFAISIVLYVPAVILMCM